MAAWIGEVFGGEYIHVCVWLSLFAVHLKPSQHCLSIGYIPIQNKKFKKKRNRLQIVMWIASSSYDWPYPHLPNYFKIVRRKKGTKSKGLAGTEVYYVIGLFLPWHTVARRKVNLTESWTFLPFRNHSSFHPAPSDEKTWGPTRLTNLGKVSTS